MITTEFSATTPTRVERGLALYLELGEGIEMVADDFYIVPSASGERFYHVDYRDESCDCPDYRYRGETCKHIYAVGSARSGAASSSSASWSLYRAVRSLTPTSSARSFGEQTATVAVWVLSPPLPSFTPRFSVVGVAVWFGNVGLRSFCMRVHNTA